MGLLGALLTFLIKPQHGSPFVSVGTQHSHGPWDKFSAEANVRDKYDNVVRIRTQIQNIKKERNSSNQNLKMILNKMKKL